MLVEVEATFEGEEVIYDAFDLDSRIKDNISKALYNIEYDTVVLYLSDDDDLVKVWECHNPNEIQKAQDEIIKLGGRK